MQKQMIGHLIGNQVCRYAEPLPSPPHSLPPSSCDNPTHCMGLVQAQDAFLYTWSSIIILHLTQP